MTKNISSSIDTDVVIIGGGPAGSTAAALLAEKGISTIVVERSKFPRYHVGESLLPANRRIFERLGVTEKVEKMAVHKPGGKWLYGDKAVMAEFAYCGKNASFFKHPYAYMVHRCEFDKMLLDNAVEQGAKVFEQTKVVDLITDQSDRVSGIVAKAENGGKFEINAGITLDCSGQRSFISTRMGTRVPNHLNRMSIFGQIKAEVNDNEVNNGWFVGQLIHDGWIWIIPLPGPTVSVGAVVDIDEYKSSNMTSEEYLHQLLSSTAALRNAFSDYEIVGDVKTTGAMGYTNPKFAGDGWALVGDAAFFVDPCYSSGVYLAMHSAEKIAQQLSESLLKSNCPAASEFSHYEEELKHHEHCVLQLVDGFYTATRSKTPNLVDSSHSA